MAECGNRWFADNWVAGGFRLAWTIAFLSAAGGLGAQNLANPEANLPISGQGNPRQPAKTQSSPELDVALDLYRYRLLQSGTRLRRYPVHAQEQRLQGTATIEVLVTARGVLGQARILQSTGHNLLDQNALDLLARAIPLTEIPSALHNRAFALTVALAFVLPD